MPTNTYDGDALDLSWQWWHERPKAGMEEADDTDTGTDTDTDIDSDTDAGETPVTDRTVWATPRESEVAGTATTTGVQSVLDGLADGSDAILTRSPPSSPTPAVEPPASKPPVDTTTRVRPRGGVRCPECGKVFADTAARNGHLAVHTRSLASVVSHERAFQRTFGGATQTRLSEFPKPATDGGADG